MVLFWSLTKTATEQGQPAVAPVQPQVQPQIQPQPIQPSMQTEQTGMDLPTWQKANSKLVNIIINFVKKNLEEPEEWAGEVLAKYKQNPYEWATLRQYAEEFSPNETFDQFISRLNGQSTVTPGTEDLAYFQNLEEQINVTVSFVSDTLSDWLTLMAQQKKSNNANELSTIAQGIGGAIDNFFRSTYQGHVPKWIDFANKNKLLPPSAYALIQSEGVVKGVYADINNWFSDTDDTYPALSGIRQLAEDEDPRLLKALEGCALSIGGAQAQGGWSLNKTDGAGNQTGDNQASNQLTPAQLIDEVKPMLPESIESGEAMAAKFIQAHPEFVAGLKVAKHPVTKEEMLPALVRAKVGTPEQLIDSAVREAFVGVSHEQQQNPKTKEWHYTDNAEHNQFVEFFKDHPEFLPKTIKPTDTDAMQDKEAILYPQFMKALEDPEILSDYMGNPSDAQPYGAPYEYLRYLYEINRVYDKESITKNIAGYGNIQQFKRLSDMVTGVLKRDFVSSKALGNKHIDTAARCYAFTKFKADAYLAKLQQLLNTHERLPLTEESYVQRDQSNQIKIWVKHKRGYTDDPNLQPIAGPLTDRNAFMLTDLVGSSEWCAKGIGMLEKIAPSALKRQETDADKLSPLEQEYKAATEKYQQDNPQAPDRLAGYRLVMAEKTKAQIAALGQKLGMNFSSPEQMIEFMAKRIEDIKSGDSGKTRSGNKSRIGANPKLFLTNLLTGKPQQYGEGSDLKTLSQALMLSPAEAGQLGEQSPDRKAGWINVLENFWTKSSEYDPYDVAVGNKINDASARGAFKFFGPYLVHKKREATRRGMVNSAFNDNSLFFFLSIMPPSPSLSGEKASEATYGRYLYELVGKRPVGTGKSDWGQVEEQINKAPNVDVYERMPDIPMSRKRFYPSEMHPSGVETREQELDRDQKGFKNIKDKRIPFNSLMGGKTLEQWQSEFLENIKKRSSDNTPEVLKHRLQSGEDSINVAKDILKKEYEGKAGSEPINIDQLFDNKLNQFNTSVKKFNPNKNYSPEEYAQWFVNNQITTHRYFRDRALKQQKELSGVDINTLSPQKKFDLFVPTRYKTDKTNVAPLKTKPVHLDISELNSLAKSDLPERFKQKLTQEPIEQVAIDYVKERKDLDDENALVFLRDKMRRYNAARKMENEVVVTSFDEYLKHYINEALVFETNYREEARKSLQDYQGKPESKIPFPKRSSVQVIMDAITKLSAVDRIISKVGKIGSRYDYIKVIDSIADEAIEEILNG